MIMMPQVMAHCWQPTNRPLFDGGASSEIYTCGTMLALRTDSSGGLFTNRHLSRANSNGETVKESSYHQHANTLRGADND